MDFDELDELEERHQAQRALKEIQRAQAEQLQRAAQEQYKQWIGSDKPQKTMTSPLAADGEDRVEETNEAIRQGRSGDDIADRIGLAGFAPVWTQPRPVTPVVAAQPPATSRRQRGFAKFKEMQGRDDTALPRTAEIPESSPAKEEPEPADPMAAFAQRLMVHAQEERELQKSWEELQSGGLGLPVMARPQEDTEGEVPALNALIAILDEEEKEEKEFEQLKPYLPELGHQAASIVPVGKDGTNPFVTEAVEVFQRFYPDVDLSSAFGDHYKEVLHAAAHRSAGHIEQLQRRNVQKADEERRAQEERRKMLRELRQRRYLIQERQRALGSLGDTKISSKAPASRLPQALVGDMTLGGAPNGLLFPGMDGAECFPRSSVSCAEPAKTRTSKPLNLLASLKLDDDDDPFNVEDLTGLPSKARGGTRVSTRSVDVGRAEREEAEREVRAAEQQQRLERLKERRMQREKAKALEVPLGKVMSWGPASKIPKRP